MSRNKSKRRRIDNSLTELVAGVRVAAQLTGGSVLSSYGTTAFSNNYSLITLNRIILTYMFTGNGIFQTAIQLPIQDAISKGIEIDSGEMSGDEIDEVMDYWEKKSLWELVLDMFSWVRLFGGGALIINTNQKPEKPLNINRLQNSPLEFYDVDRWQIDYNSSGYKDDMFYDWWEQEYFYLYGQKIHESRVIRARGKKAPSYVRRQLRGWGMSEGERMIRDLNLYLKTQDVLYEIIDEAKVDIYHIKGLANKLLTTGGTAAIQSRVTSANMIKSYVNALVLDAEETFEQKQITFGGLAEVMRENRIGIASALRMPVTKLFGLSASGFNTGESDLENYNSMVESEIRMKLRPIIRRMLELCMAHVFGYVPSFNFNFPSLRVLSDSDEEAIKSSKLNRILSLYDRGLIDSKEVGELAKKEDVVTIETKAEQGLLPPQPMAPNGPESVDPATVTLDPKDPSTTRGKSGKW